MPEYDFEDPEGARELLRKLREAGFNDEAFGIVHHFGPGTKIVKFLEWCDSVDAFSARGGNPDTHRRLKMVWDAYCGAGFTKPETFIHLAHAAVVQLPKKS